MRGLHSGRPPGRQGGQTMKISPAEQRTLRLVALALILLGLYAWCFRPLLALMGGARSESALRAELSEVRLLLNEAAEIRANAAGLAKALAAEEERFPARISAEQASLDLLRAVERMAADSGLSLQSKGYSPPEPDAASPAIRVEVSGRGSAAALTRFLLELRDSAVPLEIERLDLKADPEKRILELRAVVATILFHPGEGARR